MGRGPIRAAGGILRRRDGRIAVVHRHRHDDWSLPKGKLDRGESWEEGALREVQEETGWTARLGPSAGTVHYEVKGRPKEVRWWHMDAGEETGHPPDPKEVAAVAWLTVEEARARLTYDDERALLGAAGSDAGSGAVDADAVRRP